MRPGTVVAVLFAVGALFSQTPRAGRVPVVPGGGHLLPTGWTCRPMGKQVPLGSFPISSLLSTDGNYLLILHSGIDKPSICVLSTKTFRETDRVRLKGAWGGMAFAPGGRRGWKSGGLSARAIWRGSTLVNAKIRPNIKGLHLLTSSFTLGPN